MSTDNIESSEHIILLIHRYVNIYFDVLVQMIVSLGKRNIWMY